MPGTSNRNGRPATAASAALHALGPAPNTGTPLATSVGAAAALIVIATTWARITGTEDQEERGCE